jgi:hypothetical protein
MPTSSTTRRLALVVAAAAAVTLTHPAGAAAPKSGDLHITDPSGDANGVNNQGFGLPVPSESTSPATVSGADITSIDLKTLWVGKGKKRKAQGFFVILKLAAPLQKGVLITATMQTSVPCGDTSTIQLGYGTEALTICQGTGTSSTTIGSSEISDDGKTVTWQIDPIFKPGATVTNIDATTSVFVLGVFDDAASSGVFHYGR